MDRSLFEKVRKTRYPLSGAEDMIELIPDYENGNPNISYIREIVDDNDMSIGDCSDIKEFASISMNLFKHFGYITLNEYDHREFLHLIGSIKTTQVPEGIAYKLWNYDGVNPNDIKCWMLCVNRGEMEMIYSTDAEDVDMMRIINCREM